MKVFKAPTPFITFTDGFYEKPSVFLAGSIEMGAAENWQARMENALVDIEGTILNPRGDDWDSSWVQEISNPQFYEQVTWEINAQKRASTIAMYFDPNTKSPVTLLELGLFANTGMLIVCCPKGFWRKGNVDIVCQKYDIKTAETFDELVYGVRQRISVG